MGRRIVFASERDGQTQIYEMDSDGSNVRRLTVNSWEDTYPAYSADGSRIVFMSDRTESTELYIMNADGTNQVRLTQGNYHEGQPAWRPDAPDGEG